MSDISIASFESGHRGERGSMPSRDAARTPFEVRVEGKGRGRFENLRDAIESAQITKREHPRSIVSVGDVTTGQIVIEIEEAR
jgi:hypothetical protein